MNLFQLLIKQMRQRALGTTLTMLSVVLGVGMAISVMMLYHAGKSLFGQDDFGFDVLVGVKGSKLQLTLNTIYQMDASPGNIPLSVYDDLNPQPRGQPPAKFQSKVKIAVPYVVGDTYNGIYRIVGTLPKLFGYDDNDITKTLPASEVMEYRPGMRYRIAQGRVFDPDTFEAIIGSEVAKKTTLAIGSEFQATHAMAVPGARAELHAEKWKVVGILAPTHTASDRVVFISLDSFYAIGGHGSNIILQWYLSQGLTPPASLATAKPTYVDKNGRIHIIEKYRATLTVSAVLVKSLGGVTGTQLEYAINYGAAGPEAMAVNPASVMRDFFSTFFDSAEELLLLIALLVTIVAAVGILVSIYNSVSARMREIAILRALGATRQRVLTLICAEAGFIGFFGGLIGLIVGHVLGAVTSYLMVQNVGQGFDWWTVGLDQLGYWAIVVVIAVLAGLVPALKAYSVPVATNLVMT